MTQSRLDEKFEGLRSRAKHSEKIIKIGAIRARLDQDTLGEIITRELPEVLRNIHYGFLSISEISVLGQVKESAVHNAIKSKTKIHLESRLNGNDCVVESHEALRWLIDYRHFKATAPIEGKF